MKKSRRTQIILAGILGSIILVGIFLAATGGGATQTLEPGEFTPKPAPDFELLLLSGQTVRLSDFEGKKPVVINFWASWCGPCREEALVLAKAGKTFENDVEFIGIAINDRLPNVKSFIKEYGITYKNGLDVTGIAAKYNVTGIPTTLWIDKKGRIVAHWVGAIDEGSLTIQTEKLL